MKSLNDYLMESLLIETSNNDPRQNPPAFTTTQKRTNKKLLQHVLKIFERNKAVFDEYWQYYGLKRDPIVYTAAYNLTGNKNYRTNIIIGDQYFGNFEIVTDTAKNEVRLVNRINAGKYERVPKTQFNTAAEVAKDKERQFKMIKKGLQQLHPKMLDGLMKLVLSVDGIRVQRIDSGRQFGFVYKLVDKPDYSKCDSYNITIKTNLAIERDRKKRDRRDAKDVEDRYSRLHTRILKHIRIKDRVMKQTGFTDKVAKAFDGTDFSFANFEQWKFEYQHTKKQSAIRWWFVLKNTNTGHKFNAGIFRTTTDDIEMTDKLTVFDSTPTARVYLDDGVKVSNDEMKQAQKLADKLIDSMFDLTVEQWKAIAYAYKVNYISIY